MKKRIIGGLIAIIVVALVVVFSGCIEKTPESITPGTPSEIPTKSEGRIIDVMKQVPNGSSLIYIDLKNLRKDTDLANIYDVWKNRVGEEFREVGIPEVGISTNKLNYLAMSGWDHIIGGNFDLKKIRGYLEDEGWQQDTYRGMEVWYIEGGRINGIALFEDEIIISGKKSGVKGIIEVMKEEEESLYDNKDVVDVVNKLPKGFYVTINSVEGSLGGGLQYTSKYEAGCKNVTMYGSSREKISEEEIKWQEVVKFKDERAAEDFIEHWNEGWTEIHNSHWIRYHPAEKYPELEVTTQNEYVICSVTQKITETAG